MSEKKLEYIHMNPVVKDYLFAGENWVYNSVRNYAGTIEEGVDALQMLR